MKGCPGPCKFAHCCYEWDDMEICEHDTEFMSCLCWRDNPEAEAIQERHAAEWQAYMDRTSK